MQVRAAVLLLLCAPAWAQTFEAASVKPAALGQPPVSRPSGGPGAGDPGRIRYPNATMQALLMAAYDVEAFQISGPRWIDSDRYDIDATLPAGASREAFRAMLRHLLEERFALAAHRETRQISGYALVTARKGAKLHAAVPETAPATAADPPLKLGPDGYFVPPTRPGIFLQMAGAGGARSTFRRVTMAEFAHSVQTQLKQPVADSTGLTGAYDFALDYAIEGLDLGHGRIPVSPGAGEPPPDIISAVEEQLGLKLEARKVPVETVVVDRLERIPAGN